MATIRAKDGLSVSALATVRVLACNCADLKNSENHMPYLGHIFVAWFKCFISVS